MGDSWGSKEIFTPWVDGAEGTKLPPIRGSVVLAQPMLEYTDEMMKANERRLGTIEGRLERLERENAISRGQERTGGEVAPTTPRRPPPWWDGPDPRALPVLRAAQEGQGGGRLKPTPPNFPPACGRRGRDRQLATHRVPDIR